MEIINSGAFKGMKILLLIPILRLRVSDAGKKMSRMIDL